MKQTVFNRTQFCRVLVFLAVLIPLWFGAWTKRGNSSSPEPQRTRNRTQKNAAATKKPKSDYTKFSHQTHVVSQKLSCDSCHKVPAKNWKVARTGDAAFHDVTDFPEHASCLKCHREQFFARERPAPSICSNCHIAVTPRDTSRWLFPSLGDLTDPKLKRREFVSEFAVSFPHDKHIDVVGAFSRPPSAPDGAKIIAAVLQDKKTPASCPVCHATNQPQGNSNEEYVTKPPKELGDNFWLKKGTFKTIPNSHTTCFTCHNVDSGIAPEPKSCNVCHALLSTEHKLVSDFDPKLPTLMGITDRLVLLSWPRRVSSGAFRHEAGLHTEISCLHCHNAGDASFNTTNPRTLKVPVKSCGGEEGCHITQILDDGGALNSEIDQRKKDPKFVCTKCHITFGALPTPEGHAKALPTPKPKVNPAE
jgi:hypothetical protein